MEYLNRRGEPAFVSCKNGVESLKRISSHLEKICIEKEGILNKIKEKRDDLMPWEHRQENFLNYTKKYGIKEIDRDIKVFKDGEILMTLNESVRGKDVYIVQNTLNPRSPQDTSDNIIELNLMIDCVLRSDAANVTVILPYFSYCKQDKSQGRQPESAYVMANNIANCGANKLITMDLHNPTTKSSVDPKKLKIENLYASSLLIHYFINTRGFDGVWLAPDPGAGKTVRHYAKATQYPMALGYKYRAPGTMHKTEIVKLLGEVEGKDVAIIDDQSSTFETILEMATEAKKYGARRTEAGVTHGMFIAGAEKKINDAVKLGFIDQIAVTDTLIQTPKFLSRNNRIITLDALKMFAEAIIEIHSDRSISELYDKDIVAAMYGEKHRV